MCAWKRGVSVNPAGEIRIGQVKEFLLPSSKDRSVSFPLKIISYENFHLSSSNVLCSYALISDQLDDLPSDVSSILFSKSAAGERSSLFEFYEFLAQKNVNNILFLHAHNHASSVIPCIPHSGVPRGHIVLNEVQRTNCKVCTGDVEKWTLFVGDIVNSLPSSPGQLIETLQSITIDILPKDRNTLLSPLIDTALLRTQVSTYLYHSIVTVNDVFLLNVKGSEIVCRIVDVTPDKPFHDETTDAVESLSSDENDVQFSDYYRGLVDANTVVYPQIDVNCRDILSLTYTIAPVAKGECDPMEILYILTSDNEVFPVKKKLLRPCLSLTWAVQIGKGKYDSELLERHFTTAVEQELVEIVDPEFLDVPLVRIPIDACTFDRVLLYLEHEARGRYFRFDPLLASDLRYAAKLLKLVGLQERCEEVLGSFQSRVRKQPIPLDEVIARNNRGRGDGEGKRRKETLLIMSGMVLDISRWLEEHPGGSEIVSEQSLNVDCTVFFEIYHASRQSFLYLKEFYIGELDELDLPRVPLPINCPTGTIASDAFLEQLNRVTSWRLKREDFQIPEVLCY